MKRTGVALVAIFLALRLPGGADLLSALTRPVVVGILALLGVEAAGDGETLRVAFLSVPWDRDCAGLNVLGIVCALVVWSHRNEASAARFWASVGVGALAALGANLGRVLTIVAFRYALFPMVESPATHYLIGFLWILPFVAPVTRGGRPGLPPLHLLYFAVALSLVAATAPHPGGGVSTACALVLLASAHGCRPGHALHASAWLAAGGAIAVSTTESLWIPWLFTCPWFRPGLGSAPWSVLLATLGTVPLVVMHPVGAVVAGVGVAWEIVRLARARDPAGRTGDEDPGAGPAGTARRRLERVVLALLFLMPFGASMAEEVSSTGCLPPSGVAAVPIAFGAHGLRLVGQDPDLGVTWYSRGPGGRHHSMAVCLGYRGVHVLPSSEHADIYTDGRSWYRECFVQGTALHGSWSAYLLATALPFSDTGAHVVIAARADAMSADRFLQESGDLQSRLLALVRASRP